MLQITTYRRWEIKENTKKETERQVIGLKMKYDDHNIFSVRNSKHLNIAFNAQLHSHVSC